jgi:hypothetical protein
MDYRIKNSTKYAALVIAQADVGSDAGEAFWVTQQPLVMRMNSDMRHWLLTPEAG